MNVERGPARVGSAIALVSGLLVLGTASRAAAQVVLLVPEGPSSVLEVEPAIADAMRQALGASVRALEPSLDDLALAAGCADQATEPSCIARIAAASRARLVAVESVSRGGSGFVVHLDLRRGSDGRPVRSLSIDCASSVDCGEQVLLAFESDDAAVPVHDARREPIAAPPPRPSPSDTRAEPIVVAPSPPAAEAPHPAPPRRSGRPIPFVPNVLFGLSVAMSLGAMVAGGVAVGAQSAHDTLAAIVATHPDQLSQLSAVDAGRDLALGVGTGFALAGACLAAAGAITMALLPESDPRDPRLQLSAQTNGRAFTLTLDGTF
jgi:hypothetical protein